MADELWKRQPWDSNTSFDRFWRFYLFQEKPRSVNEAYRQYRRAQSGNEQVTIKQAPGSWRNWSCGKTARGVTLPGAKTWEARARAYDDHLAELERQKWEERRSELREADWQTGQKLREQANAALDQVPQFLKTTRRVIKGGKGQPDREVITMGLRLNEVSGAAETASKLQRLAAEMPTERQQVDVTGVTADDLVKARDQAKLFEDELLHGDSGPDPDGSDSAGTPDRG